MIKRIFTTDCEGPISKNDNAFEISSHFIPFGDDFFPRMSKYDDVQADVFKRQGYKPGDTLKLILPFLKASDVTNEAIMEYSKAHIVLVPEAAETLQFVNGIMPSAMISTSYEQYIRTLCDVVEFPFENTYCTRMDIDRYNITDDEKISLLGFKTEITNMPMIEIPPSNKFSDFSERDKNTVKRMDEIIWEEIAKMEVGKMLEDVNPIGGIEKAKAVEDFVLKHGGKLEDTMYVGDSITDREPFRLVRERGGITVSFNGNNYAIREAEIAVLSSNTQITSHIANVFSIGGRMSVFNWVKNLNSLTSYEGSVEPNPKYFPQVEIITDENRERLAKESSKFRKEVRGEAIGKLG